MSETILIGAAAPNIDPTKVNMPGTVEFIPPAPQETDRALDGAAAANLALGRLVEPFGTEQGIPTINAASTGGPTGAKGGGNYDDYKTADE